jgi:chaperonin cofactor prefoldin
MSFDLEAHLKHHAFLFKKLATVSSDSIHFNFSFLDLQFLDKDEKDIMSKLLDTLLLPACYNVANGKRKDKHGNVVQKFTTRKVDLGKDVQAMAIHLKGPEGEDTMPHIHFIAKGSARFGNGYSLLKKHVSVVSEKFALLPNFDEMVEHNPLSVKSLSCAVSQITWSWKKSTNAQLKSEISSRGLDKSISLLKSYCLKTKNLTYYVKSMEGLKTRLNRMQLDIVYEGHHLRDTYPIPLRDEDMEVIKLIQDKTFTQKSMQLYLKNPILRDFIRHSTGTSKPYIYDALKEQTNLLDNVSKNQQAVTSYKKLMQKETPIRKSQLTPKDNQNLSRKNELRRIIIEASISATNEKTFRALMQTAGYADFGLKKKQGKVLGCIYKELESKRAVNFTELGLHWGELKKSFMLNSRKLENAETLPSPTLSKKAPTSKETITSQKRTKTPKATNITYKSTSIKQKKNKKKDISLMRRKYEKLIRAVEDKIEHLEHYISKLRKGISKFKESITRTGSRIIKIGKQITENFSSKEAYNVLESDKSTLSREIETEEGYESSIRENIDIARADINTEEDAHEKFGNGVISKSIHTKLTKDIGDRKSINQDLRGEISYLERKIAKNAEPDNTYSLQKLVIFR